LGMAAYFWLYLHQSNPGIVAELQQKGGRLTRLLEDKYGFDDFNQRVFAGGGQLIGRFLWKSSDQRLIDGAVVNGSAKAVGWIAARARHLQSGMLYHYAFAMILGLVVLLTLFVTF
ncbi:MAG: NADH-quinone oxidoreductase subunit L, partial [Chromatiaceae bacterium]|nr:NADH-quinone oxidoreductase subunit L [Chromatiaceae bacterium]